MTAFGALRLTPPPLSPRTRLYSLPPIGVGTPVVESLTGYLMRLADAHCVATGALVGTEVLPVVCPNGLAGVPPATWLERTAAHMNGTGNLASAVVAALAALTGRQELASLTMLRWSGSLSESGLLRFGRRRRAWCPACYAEALDQRAILYEPLLWSIAAVVACARHRLRLLERCPYVDCGRPLPVLAAFGRPGHCSYCRRLLGQEGGTERDAAVRQPASSWECWVAEQVAALLAATPRSPPASGAQHLVDVLAVFTATAGPGQAGTHQAFARTAGVHANLVLRWRSGHAKPTLPTALRMAHGLDVSLVALVHGDTSARTDGSAAGAAEVVAPAKRSRRPAAVVAVDAVRERMQALCAGNELPPPSGAAVARRLGCPAAALSRQCPQEWTELVRRRRDYLSEQQQRRRHELEVDVRRAMEHVSAQGFYPSFKRILPLLRQRIHPRRTDLYAIRQRILQDLGWSNASRQDGPTSSALTSRVGAASGPD